jgi:hypothetical protein
LAHAPMILANGSAGGAPVGAAVLPHSAFPKTLLDNDLRFRRRLSVTLPGRW